MTDTTNPPEPVTTLAFLIADLYGQLRMAQAAVADRERLAQELNSLDEEQCELSERLSEAHEILSVTQSQLREIEKSKDARIAELEEELAEMQQELNHWKASKGAQIAEQEERDRLEAADSPPFP